MCITTNIILFVLHKMREYKSFLFKFYFFIIHNLNLYELLSYGMTFLLFLFLLFYYFIYIILNFIFGISNEFDSQINKGEVLQNWVCSLLETMVQLGIKKHVLKNFKSIPNLKKLFSPFFMSSSMRLKLISNWSGIWCYC